MKAIIKRGCRLRPASVLSTADMFDGQKSLFVAICGHALKGRVRLFSRFLQMRALDLNESSETKWRLEELYEVLWCVLFSHSGCLCRWLVFPLNQSWQLLKASDKPHPAAPSPPGREPYNKRSHTCVCVCWHLCRVFIYFVSIKLSYLCVRVNVLTSNNIHFFMMTDIFVPWCVRSELKAVLDHFQ